MEPGYVGSISVLFLKKYIKSLCTPIDPKPESIVHKLLGIIS
ncbi:hypothetical protein ACV242_001342 [Peribacillus simplex]